DVTGWAVTGTQSFNSTQNYLTDVGAYTASSSPYGTFDQGGDVFQWNEGKYSGSMRAVRGGSWVYNQFHLSSAFRYSNFSNNFPDTIGFRVATVAVPEPNTFGLAAIALLFVVLAPYFGAKCAHSAHK